MPYFGQTAVVACCDDSRCTWSETSRTYLTRSVHAAEACALPFMTGRDRPRPGCRWLLRAAGYRQITDRITLSDREALGEYAPSRRVKSGSLIVGPLLGGVLEQAL